MKKPTFWDGFFRCKYYIKKHFNSSFFIFKDHGKGRYIVPVLLLIHH
jgi:hypothetical protein